MNILANWKIYVVMATLLVVFYFAYTAKIAENAILKNEVTILSENIKTKDALITLKNEVIASKERLLTENRDRIIKKDSALDDLEEKLSKRPDVNDDAHPYLKEYFNELGKIQ